MAITWRNIGQSNNSGNSLIKSGSDTITQGINSLQNAAQEVSNEGTRQYNTQADINTADILSDINRFDQDEIDAFDVSNLNKEYGTQYDATGIADALDARVRSLQDAARQDKLDNDTFATNALARQNSKGQIDARKDAKDKEEKFSNFSKQVNKNIGKYVGIDDLTDRVTKLGFEQNMSGEEIARATNTAKSLYESNIAPTQEDKALLQEHGQKQNQFTQMVVKEQLSSLDKQARENGIDPDLVNLQNEPDSPETTYEALAKKYDSSVGNEWLGEDSVKSFETKLARQFADKNIPLPNGAELDRFLKLGFENSSTFLTSNGFNLDGIQDDIDAYIKMRENREGIDNYNKTKALIQKKGQEVTKLQAKHLAGYAKAIEANRRADFTGEGIKFDNVIPDNIRTDLYGGILNTKDFFPKATAKREQERKDNLAKINKLRSAGRTGQSSRTKYPSNN